METQKKVFLTTDAQRARSRTQSRERASLAAELSRAAGVPIQERDLSGILKTIRADYARFANGRTWQRLFRKHYNGKNLGFLALAELNGLRTFWRLPAYSRADAAAGKIPFERLAAAARAAIFNEHTRTGKDDYHRVAAASKIIDELGI